MRRSIVTALVLFWAFAVPVQVYSYTIDDTTNIGVGYTKDTTETYRGTVDYLGSEFNTAGIDVSFSGSQMTVDLYTTFVGAFQLESIQLSLADLFFDTGSGWQYGVDMQGYLTKEFGSLYSVESTRTSEEILQNKTSGNWMYGRYYAGDTNSGNVIVDGSGTQIGEVSFADQRKVDELYVYSLSFDYSLLGLSAGQEFGIHWGTAFCANDLVIGTATAPVPEPSVIFLFGTGLAGIVGSRILRRK